MLLLLSNLALASGTYPGVVASELGVDTPGCALCHDGTPSVGTATTPFGAALFDLGLSGQSDDTLVELLGELETAGTDSDGDGVGDIQELRDGSDPNSDGAALPTPEYGCIGSTRAGAPSGLAGLAGVLLLWGFSRRRRL